jgi:hypothetical protein
MERSFVTVNGEQLQWDEDQMEFLNIEEDIQGYDVVTFKYKNKTYTSYLINK